MSGEMSGLGREDGVGYLADGIRFALGESTLPGLVICIILLIISSFTWTVMVTKFRTVLKARRASDRFLALFRSSKDPLSAYASGVRAEDAPLFRVYEAGSKELACQIMGEWEVDESFQARIRASGKMSPTQMEGVKLAMERAAGEGVQRLESSMTLLATAVSGAPFLGLLGTVWGVMDTFVGVAAAEVGAGLASMAPGVASALVTTVVALLVAIPAMFGYNFLAHCIKSTVVELDNFSAEFCGMLDRHYVDHGRRFVGTEERAAAPRSESSRSSAHALLLDRPSGVPRAENARRSERRAPKPEDPSQPSLLDHVGELEMANGAAAPFDRGIRPVKSPSPSSAGRPELEILSPPPSEAPVAARRDHSAVGRPAVREHASVADIIAAEKQKGAGLLLRTLRRSSPKRREPQPAEL